MLIYTCKKLPFGLVFLVLIALMPFFNVLLRIRIVMSSRDDYGSIIIACPNPRMVGKSRV